MKNVTKIERVCTDYLHWWTSPLIVRELPFQKGDIVYIFRQVDQNWYEGEHHGRVGIFPRNYVEVCTPTSLKPYHFPLCKMIHWLGSIIVMSC